MSTPDEPVTFNGPLEAGIRAVCILGAAFPSTYDLQRLVALDYLLTHTGDIGGPESLHPPAPLHSAEILVRRQIVERALLLMSTRDLVRQIHDAAGIKYHAGENAAPFLSAMDSDYLKALKERGAWLAENLGSYTDSEFHAVMRRFFARWVEEFQHAERSMGTEA